MGQANELERFHTFPSENSFFILFLYSDAFSTHGLGFVEEENPRLRSKHYNVFVSTPKSKHDENGKIIQYFLHANVTDDSAVHVQKMKKRILRKQFA